MIPQVRVSERIVVQIFDVPVLQVLEEIVGVVRLLLSASNNVPLRKSWMFRFSGRGRDPSGDQVIPQVRVSVRIVEQIVDAPVPQVLGEIVEVVRFILERIQHRTAEEILDVSVPLFQVQTAEVIKVILQGWVSERIVEQIVFDLFLGASNIASLRRCGCSGTTSRSKLLK